MFCVYNVVHVAFLPKNHKQVFSIKNTVNNFLFFLCKDIPKFVEKSRPLITRTNFALDRRTILCLFVSGFQGQVFKDKKILLERSKKMKEQKRNTLQNPRTFIKKRSLAS